MTSVVQVTGLTKRYGELIAVNNLSFSVQKGVCFGLLGPNGAGKTSTLEMLEGLVKPTSGNIELFGQPVNKRTRQRIGIQFQHTALQDHLRVGEALNLFASFYRSPMAIDQLQQLCELDSIIDQDVKSLSGGQRQRVLLALALVNDPDLLFLDEPTIGLDPQARHNFWQLIEKIKQQGKTILLTTHYMDEAELLCDEVAIMDAGAFIAYGAPKKLLAEYFSGLVIELPSEGVELDALPAGSIQKADKIHIYCDDVEPVLTQLMANNMALSGMQIHQPSLEDLFLKLTGEGLRD